MTPKQFTELTRRAFFSTTVAALATSVLPARLLASDKSPVWPASDKAHKFVRDNIAIDSLMAPVSPGWPREEMFEEYHDRSLNAGITATGMTGGFGYLDFAGAMTEVTRFLKHIYAADRYTIVRNVAQIRQAHEEGKHAFFFESQSSAPLTNNPGKYMPLLKNMSFGTMGLAYNERFRAGDGNFVLPELQGPVSAYGKTVIDACHKYRVILDTSHSGEPTALSAIEYSQKVAPDRPVIETHGGVVAMYDYPAGETRLRPISDERIQAIAATGGTVALTMLPFLMIAPDAPETRPEDVVDRIDYVTKLTGIDTVALASDDTYEWKGIFEFALANPQMFDDGGNTVTAAKLSTTGVGEPGKIYAAIVDEMWKRGYSDEDASKVIGGNLMRVYEQVWG